MEAMCHTKSRRRMIVRERANGLGAHARGPLIWRFRAHREQGKSERVFRHLSLSLSLQPRNGRIKGRFAFRAPLSFAETHTGPRQ